MASEKGTCGDDGFKSMKAFKKFVPVLKKYQHKLHKKIKTSKNAELVSGTNKKLTVVEKYLKIIEAETNVPANLARRMEIALEDMVARSVKMGSTDPCQNNSAKDHPTCNISKPEDVIEACHQDDMIVPEKNSQIRNDSGITLESEHSSNENSESGSHGNVISANVAHEAQDLPFVIKTEPKDHDFVVFHENVTDPSAIVKAELCYDSDGNEAGDVPLDNGLNNVQINMTTSLRNDLNMPNVDAVNDAHNLDCPECPDFKNVSVSELKYHFFSHAGYEPCFCELCSSKDYIDQNTIPGLKYEVNAECSKNVQIELDVSNLLNAVINAHERKKRKIKGGNHENAKRTKFDDSLEKDGNTSDISSELSFSDSVYSSFARLGEYKKRHLLANFENSDEFETLGDTADMKIENDTLLCDSNDDMEEFLIENEMNEASSFTIKVPKVKFEPEYPTGHVLSSNVKPSKRTARKGGSSPLNSPENFPYECSFCGSCYKSLPTYRQHTYRHFKDYFTYRCSYCNRGFMRRDHVKVHMQGYHPHLEPKFEQIEPPSDPIILLNIPNNRLAPGPTGSRIARVSELFKCALCDIICVPGDMTGHFEIHHPQDLPQMKLLKEARSHSFPLGKKVVIPPPVASPTKPQNVAKKSMASHSNVVSKNMALKSTAKPSIVSNCAPISNSSADDDQLYSQLKIWNRNHSIQLTVKELMKMINLNCQVKLVDIKSGFL